LKSKENSRIKKFIIKNIDYPRFFGYFNKNKYPVLFLITRKYLEIPVSEVSLERFFYQDTNIIVTGMQRYKLKLKRCITKSKTEEENLG
jgi:hypothetical protein